MRRLELRRQRQLWLIAVIPPNRPTALHGLGSNRSARRHESKPTYYIIDYQSAARSFACFPPPRFMSSVDAGDFNFSLFAEKGSCQFLHASLVPMLLGKVSVDIWEAFLKLGYLGSVRVFMFIRNFPLSELRRS